jgi:hypothetical protein
MDQRLAVSSSALNLQVNDDDGRVIIRAAANKLNCQSVFGLEQRASAEVPLWEAETPSWHTASLYEPCAGDHVTHVNGIELAAFPDSASKEGERSRAR